MRFNTTWIIFTMALMLITTSIVMVYSTSAAIAARVTVQKHTELRNAADTEQILKMSSHSTYFLIRQVGYALLGIVMMLVVYNIDYERYRKYAFQALVATFVMLLLVYLPGIGVRVNGARRWLNVGFNLQVSELAKLVMILYMAKILTERHTELKRFWKGFVPPVAIAGLFMGAIAPEPDLGAAVMLGVIVYCMWFVSGMRLAHLASFMVIGIIGVTMLVLFAPWRMQRIMAFIDPIENRKDTGWQLVQSLISIGTGGTTGLGLGDGPQKYQFLSEGHTDFIFAGICEEFGMVGAVAIFLIYATIMVQGIRVATKAPDMYGSLIAIGITIMISMQAFVNMYVVVGLLPTKGLTLPLVSYGGSSLIINCMAVGVLLNISKYTEISSAVVPRKTGVPAHA